MMTNEFIYVHRRQSMLCSRMIVVVVVFFYVNFKIGATQYIIEKNVKMIGGENPRMNKE
jgi:hypothetical protein